MKPSIRYVICSFAACCLLSLAARAACDSSPKVTVAVGKAKATLLKQCRDAGVLMHNKCDQVPACAVNMNKDLKKKFTSKLQICIDSRKSITKTWYEGQGDAGHDVAIDNKINQLNGCLR